MIRKNVVTAMLYTVVTTILFGLAYPLAVTGVAQLLLKDKADGQLIYSKGASGDGRPRLIGSLLTGQPFSGPPISIPGLRQPATDMTRQTQAGPTSR